MGIVAIKIVRNGSPPQQRGFTGIVKRISKDNVDLAVSNVIQECRRYQLNSLAWLTGRRDDGESGVMLQNMSRRL